MIKSIRLPESLSEKLEQLAEATGSSISFLAAHAIQDFLDREGWKEIEKEPKDANILDSTTNVKEPDSAIKTGWRSVMELFDER